MGNWDTHMEKRKGKEKVPGVQGGSGDIPVPLPLASSPTSLARYNNLQKSKSRLDWKLRQESTGNSLAVWDYTLLG